MVEPYRNAKLAPDLSHLDALAAEYEAKGDTELAIAVHKAILLLEASKRQDASGSLSDPSHLPDSEGSKAQPPDASLSATGPDAPTT